MRRCCFSFSSSSLKNDESSGGADCMIIRFWSLPLTTKNDSDAIDISIAWYHIIERLIILLTSALTIILRNTYTIVCYG